MPTWPSGTALGLAYDQGTLVLALAMTGLWIASLWLVAGGGRGWRAVPLSLLGWSWIAFGLAFVARFWVLSIDAVTYGDLSERLLLMSPAVVDQALLLGTLYWAAVLLAYRFGGAPRLNPLASVGRVVGAGAVSAYDALAVLAVAAMVLGADVERTPPRRPGSSRSRAAPGGDSRCAAGCTWRRASSASRSSRSASGSC